MKNLKNIIYEDKGYNDISPLKKSHLTRLLYLTIILLFFALNSSISAANFTNSTSSVDVQNFLDKNLTDNQVIFEQKKTISGFLTCNILSKFFIKLEC